MVLMFCGIIVEVGAPGRSSSSRAFMLCLNQLIHLQTVMYKGAPSGYAKFNSSWISLTDLPSL